MAIDNLDAIVRAGRRQKLFTPAPGNAVSLDRPEIERLVQHRDPFLFVDRISAVNKEQLAILGSRQIDPNDPLFRGHFPGTPIYPGVLQLEMMGQLGLCLLGLLQDGRLAGGAESAPRAARALKIHHAVFLTPVHPGDILDILAKVIESDEYTAICAGQIALGDTICAFAVMEVFFVDS